MGHTWFWFMSALLAEFWSKSPVLFRSYPQANIWLGVRSSDCFMGSYLSLCCTQAEILLDLALVEQTII